MALLFANVAEQYASKKQEEDVVELSAKVSDLFDVIDDVDGAETKYDGMAPQKVFMTSVANEYYKKSIEDINNTKIGNKAVRKKNQSSKKEKLPTDNERIFLLRRKQIRKQLHRLRGG